MQLAPSSNVHLRHHMLWYGHLPLHITTFEGKIGLDERVKLQKMNLSMVK
ncbi:MULTISPECIES: hypothetical protein [Paenibacillus]|nr:MULTISPECIES: hypothetical protein [Paenibacillus]